jgi:hypothetical protein
MEAVGRGVITYLEHLKYSESYMCVKDNSNISNFPYTSNCLEAGTLSSQKVLEMNQIKIL